MRRRSGFTLIEMLVSVALVLFIMVIMTEAFGKGLESFRTLKAIGDMETRLRTASSILRRDLNADHFEGKRRLSDPPARWNGMGRPREGFFRVFNRPLSPLELTLILNEGGDSDGIAFRRRPNKILHFSVKLRGNNRSDFFTAQVPANCPLLVGPNSRRTTFFDQPADARFEEPGIVYSSQWAEVAYFLLPNGNTAGTQPLYTLYRAQFIVVADNSLLNWPPNNAVIGNPNDYAEVSCTMHPNDNTRLYFNNPTDLSTRSLRVFNPALSPANQSLRAATPLLSDVLSFDVQTHTGDAGDLDTFDWNLNNQMHSALSLTLRVWDAKTKLARQMTILQEL